MQYDPSQHTERGPRSVVRRAFRHNSALSVFHIMIMGVLQIEIFYSFKHPPIFHFLSVGKSFSVTPKLVGFHRFSPTKLTDNLKKIGRFFLSGKVGRFFCRWGNCLVGHKLYACVYENKSADFDLD